MTGEGPTAYQAPLVRPSSWRPWQRVLFRFAFVFWTVWILQSDLLWQATALVPFVGNWVLPWPSRILNWPAETLTQLLASHVFYLSGVAATHHQTGSGDTALAWIGQLSDLLLALVVAGVWSAIAALRRGRAEYRTVYAYLRLALRFCLGGVLLSYGFAKVFDGQFSPPGLSRLGERYGDASPMGLLWTFMGYSVPYTVFAGVAELVPGLLLFFRRTATLGALLAAAVLLNVVVLNFCYDVPVKLYSTTLWLMSLFLLLPDVGPLWMLLVRHRPAQLSHVPLPRPERRRLRITAYCLQAFVIASLLYATILGSYNAWWRKLPNGKASNVHPGDPQSIDGTWTVDRSSGFPAGAEWVNVSVGSVRYGSNDYLQVTERNGSRWNVLVSTDANQTFHFLRKNNTELHWSRGPQESVLLQGTWLNQPAQVTMHPSAGAEYPLNTRGFHWVQEYPFNH